jgi:hypothetical protein
MTKDIEEGTGGLFDKRKYILLIAGALLIVFGFILMSGGGTDDLNQFHEEEIFSHVRITLAPYIEFIGYALVIAAIMIKKKS